MSESFFENTTEHGYNGPDMFDEMKKPKTKEAIEDRVFCLASKIPDIIDQNMNLMPLKPKIRNEKIVESIYNSKFEGTYQGTPEQLARVFSYLFIRTRDTQEIQGNYVQIKLNNENSTINVRSEGDLNTKFSSIKHGVTVKDLGETKIFKDRNYKKVEFYSVDQGVKIGFIAENLTEPVKTKSLKQLDGYIRSIGLNPTIELKRAAFNRVYPFKDYRGDLDPSDAFSPAHEKEIRARISRDNNEVYHKLAQEYELRRLIDTNKIRLYCHESIEGFKKEITDTKESNARMEEATPTELKELKESVQAPSKITNPDLPKKKTPENTIQRKQKAATIETKNNLVESVLSKIENNENIQDYLQNKHPDLPQEKRLAKFKRSIGAAKDNFADNIMTFTYLLQHSYKNGENIQLWEYYQEKTGKNWSDLGKSGENALFRKYAGEVQEIYSGKKMSNNLTIMRGLIIEHELGTKFENVIEEEKEKSLFNFKEHGLDHSQIQGRKAEFDGDGKTYCSKTVRLYLNKYLNKYGIVAAWPASAQAFINKAEKNGSQALNRATLAQELKSRFTKNGETIFDVFPKTSNGHRCICFIGKDANVYVLDDYNYSRKPVLLTQYLNNPKYQNLTFILNKGYKVSPNTMQS
ncbi:hypothetical protein A9Q91_05625 [Candidatus Gracilibacteria bacterium 28_42_T64]|nr:hypothetical protein A9Q91_05625 [Candidatus Gracilibacteria bacterium 28_42_T64]